ncbi:DNA polymerase [Crossiella sp. CA198]|uniref:DNA polymerase n=1 Tax=Crossiella sp. CA198 TaxID=3455607 RepID=UPI003F8D7192
MRVQHHRIAGEQVVIRVAESRADLDEFERWAAEQGRRPVAVDTEATGLNAFSAGFRLRMVQFGTAREAWVIPVDTQGIPPEMSTAGLGSARRVLACHPALVAHNAPFDALVLDRHAGVDLDALWPRLTDTAILAHLCDPRGPEDGGPGLKLKGLAALHVDPDAPDTADGLTAAFRTLGLTTETGWAQIPLDHPTYTLYAGLDVILTARLHTVLADLVAARGFTRLAEFEAAVALVCAKIQRRGVRVDPEYLTALRADLLSDAERWTDVAAGYGVRSINAPAQVVNALLGMGETLTEITKSGALKVDKEVLAPLADLDREWERIGAREPNLLADAVIRGKRSAKWAVSYAGAMLDYRDADDRIHPSIASLRARTARMSISRPALQQLPSKEARVRRGMLADDDASVWGSVDYQAVEMRVIAALSGDPVMIEAIRAGRDLHGYTAELVYGPDYTLRQRNLMKGVGLGKLFGGGADTLARQTGAPVDQVRHATRRYDRVYRGITRYSARLVRRAEYGRREVTTPTGRVIPLDRNRLYAATNYIVQSTARDVLADALLRVDDAGLLDYVRLPVHDELVFSAPADTAHEVGRALAETMAVTDFLGTGVPLTTDLEIGGRSWGSLYELAA